MKWVFKTAVIIVANVFVFMLVERFVPGFKLIGGFSQILLVAAVFTALNYAVKPILKLILGPLIVITLGLGLILVNMLVLFILDNLMKNLTIEGTLALFYSSIILGFANFILHLVFKKK